MSERAILDTGPLVALLDKDERNHPWARETFRKVRAPFLTCEPVVTEAMFLLRNLPPAQGKLLEWVASGSLSISFDLGEEASMIRSLWTKYRDVPMSLADACLVRMAEVFGDYKICTMDRGFRVYRKNGADPIPLIMPEVAP